MENLFPTSYDDATVYKIDHAGRVSREIFQTIIGFFFALATIALLGRVGVRLVIRRRLFLDDYILLFGYAALISATAVIYRFCHLIYVLNAFKYERTVIPTLQDLQAIGQAQAINYSLLAAIWTAICSVKLCFLAALKSLIANVSRRVTIFYWFAVALSIVTWCLSWTIAWIICPYVGAELILHCSPETPFVKTLALSIMVTFLDIVTDLIIVSIPIWILRNVRLKLKQKFAIAVFLCLSVVMIATTITRMALTRFRGHDDYTSEYLILYLEACIAVLMACIAAFRSVFVENKRRGQEEQHGLHNLAGNGEGPRRPENLRGRIQQMRAKANEDAHLQASMSGTRSYLPRAKLDGPKLSGVLTFINSLGSRSQSAKSTSSQSRSGALSSVDDVENDGWMYTGRARPNDAGFERLPTARGDEVRPVWG
ncbi:uncharacterized protein N0V89_005974 [Didymosphaeria variabile]|uniref:Rhodopsin domain-containing protein n=1 Tax=Didymosphaeria variabile TaxID=1932322 RepID=A0A9W8XP72_9PLEO|nr:uncharacterized protein N0V89_005974 [Didymosphaeria variabile]KAJ4354240.1 hypothetical protein N0V89_005974 [Didymosphaeria variabile]